MWVAMGRARSSPARRGHGGVDISPVEACETPGRGVQGPRKPRKWSGGVGAERRPSRWDAGGGRGLPATGVAVYVSLAQ